MTCINPNSSLFKEQLESIPNPILASIAIDRASKTSSKEEAERLFNTKLKEKLFPFIEGLGISINIDPKVLKEFTIKEKSPVAAFDMLQKYLALPEDISNKDLLLQSANIIYSFLGTKSELFKNINQSVKNWKKYDSIYASYFDGGNHSFAHKQTSLHLIAEMLEYGVDNEYIGEKRENVDIDKDYFLKRGFRSIYEDNSLLLLFNKLWNWIDKYIFNNKINFIKAQEELLDIVSDIVDDVYKQNYSKFIRDYVLEDGVFRSLKNGSLLEQKFYDKTFDKDPFIRDFVNALFENTAINYKLSGSQTLRKYGRVIRSITEDLHDVDGSIPLDTFLKEKNSTEFYNWIQEKGLLLSKTNRKKFSNTAYSFIKEQEWYKSLEVLAPSWTFEQAFIGGDHKKGESISIQGYIEHPTETEIDEKTKKRRPKRYNLDFFLRTAEGNYPETYNDYWEDWKEIFIVKLLMGRKKDLNDLIYFIPFKDDKYKFVTKGFRYFSFLEREKEFVKIPLQENKEEDNKTATEISDTLSKTLEERKATPLSAKELSVLDTHLIEFLKHFNVKSEEIKNDLRMDTLGLVDIINKTLWYSNNRDVPSTIPKSFAQMIVSLMGKDHKDLKEIYENITSWNKYEKIHQSFYTKYKGNEEKIKYEAISQLIKEALEKNYKIKGIGDSLLKRIKKFLNEFFEFFIVHKMEYSVYFADKIANNILRGDRQYIYKITKKKEKLSYENAVENNPLAKKIINRFSKRLKFPLAGSLALAANEADIYRGIDIHDLDFAVDGRIDENINELNASLEEFKAYPLHEGIENIEDGFTTYTYLIPSEGLQIYIKDGKTYKDTLFTNDVQLKDEEGNTVQKTSKNLIIVDFFVHSANPTNQVLNREVASNNEIYLGKFRMKNNRSLFFNREKDLGDFILHNPVDYQRTINDLIFKQESSDFYFTEDSLGLKNISQSNIKCN